MNDMRILHAYCMNYNLGDHALAIGVKNILRQFFPVTYIVDTNIQGTQFSLPEILKINKAFDLLVIGGGGIIHGNHWPNGWFWLIDKENIKNIEIPFIVYGAGYNFFRGEDDITEQGIEHLKETQKYAKYFSVRNDGSFEKLKKFTGIEAIEIADPGFWSEMGINDIRPIQEPYVIVQLAADKPQFRFGTQIDIFIAHLKKVIRRLDNDYTVVIAPHVLPDIAFSKRLLEDIKTKRTQLWNFGDFAFDHVEKALLYYKHAEFVLGMRGHAQICPLGMETPVISLGNHDKHLGLVKKLGLEKYHVDIYDIDFYKKINAIIELLISEIDSYRQQCHRINAKLYDHTQKEFQVLANEIVDK